MTNQTLEDPNKYYSLKIISKELITHDVIKFVIELPTENHILGTKSGQHFYISANIDNETIIRKYTPINLENQLGIFEFLVKIYRKNGKFLDGGKMTQYLETLNIGDYVDIQGPIGRCCYLHNGFFELKNEKSSPKIKKRVNHVGMIAGGSGVVAFLQISRTICNDLNDNTKIYLIFSNHTEDDIIYKQELDSFEKNYPNKFKVWYTITRSIKPDWKYDIGHVNKDMFTKHLPPPNEDTLIMVCGPKGMVWQTTFPILEQIGYTEDMIFKY